MPSGEVFDVPSSSTGSDEREARARTLAALVTRTPSGRDRGDVRIAFDDAIGALGLRRPEPFDPSADSSPSAFLFWLLRMAAHTYERSLDPPASVPPDLVRRLEVLLAGRPRESAEHAQFHIDAPSVLRRAAIVQSRWRASPGPVLALGDDDAVSLALLLLGVTDVVAVDIDEGLLSFLERAAHALGQALECHRVDVLEDPLPSVLVDRFAVIVTDPPRSYEDCFGFLSFGAACLRREGPSSLLWADHPDWNFEYDAVNAALAELRLVVREILPNVHAYPLSPAWMPDPVAKARELGVEVDWLEGLLRATVAWTHLHVLSAMEEDGRRTPGEE